MATKPKLIYFPGPGGRAEPSRLAFHIAGMDFEDVRVQPQDWMAYKPDTPWGSMPLIEVPGRGTVAQSSAILRFVGRMTGLYPEDPYDAAKCDEWDQIVEEIPNACIRGTPMQFSKTLQEPVSSEVRLGARATMADDQSNYLHGWLRKIDKKLSEIKTEWVAGDKMTVADLRIFVELTAMWAGWYDGFPKDPDGVMGRLYPNINAHRAKVAALDKVQEWYSLEHNQDKMRVLMLPKEEPVLAKARL